MTRASDDTESGDASRTTGGLNFMADVTANPNNPFNDKAIRQGFIQKVYGILAVMLGVTFAVAGFFRFYKPAFDWLLANYWILWVGLGIYFVTSIMLLCCNLGRVYPCNYILLGLLTLSMSLITAGCTIAYSIDTIVIAAGVTFLITLLVSLFSCWTSFDFTKMIWIMVMVLIAFMLFSVGATMYSFFSGKSPAWLQLVIGLLGTVIFTIYLAIDTQMIMGGRKYELSPEDYAFGALCLYIDIIQIFLYLLMVIGNRRSR